MASDGAERKNTASSAWNREGTCISLKLLHHSFLAVWFVTRLFSFSRTKSVLKSAIAAQIFAGSTGQYPAHLLFCYDFSETTCVTSRIRHSPFYARNWKLVLCISFLTALRTIRTNCSFSVLSRLFGEKCSLQVDFCHSSLKVWKNAENQPKQG